MLVSRTHPLKQLLEQIGALEVVRRAVAPSISYCACRCWQLTQHQTARDPLAPGPVCRIRDSRMAVRRCACADKQLTWLHHARLPMRTISDNRMVVVQSHHFRRRGATVLWLTIRTAAIALRRVRSWCRRSSLALFYLAKFLSSVGSEHCARVSMLKKLHGGFRSKCL
ncbi:hypothetical protein K431DRAFT_107602 [Polychaeton citri CBS 116435]|uniref:Uncharacterized protein n=1 Tax=Polychaeton citri CBS 116435 TaxID=1314669 RepID=A0A9P4Q4K4_9PEZI|nr:hypothetical protein K431DRAFT_107602 [Polychaeton citri CBS 116435]